VILRYAVVTTHERPDDFRDCVVAIAPQVDLIIAVEHQSTYARRVLSEVCKQSIVLPYREEVPNISRMWNMGLQRAETFAAGWSYHVAVLNDDVVCPPDWFDRVSQEIERASASAGCVRRDFDPRMAGYAFILNGDDGLYADERFQWWYGDDDLQSQAENLHGVVWASGADVEHRHPNSTTVGTLAAVAQQDQLRYKEKWG
jgi:FAD/FMN-containing dehydrogenase